MSHCYFSKETEALEKAAHSRPEIRAARGGPILRERMPVETRAPRKRRREMPMPRQDFSAAQMPAMKKGGCARKR